jgi:uncharacterized protein YegJ (DUF2314 family)
MPKWFSRDWWRSLINWLLPPDKRKIPSEQGEEDETRLISFVALLAEPVQLEAHTVARLASEAWKAELSVEEETGADGFVVGTPVTLFIRYRNRMFFVNMFDRPYVEDVDEIASQISDIRLSGLFAKHKAWISCDATGVTPETPDSEIREAYRLCGWLMSKLVDSNTLALLIPDQERIYPSGEKLEELLKSDDPFAAVTEENYAPVVAVDGEDPRMQAAVEEARRRWPEFVTAFESRGPGQCSVKCPISGGGNTEFIWIEVTAIENETIYGTLANDPMDLGALKLGSRVKATAGEINDWIFFDETDSMHGGFTIKVVEDISKERASQKSDGDGDR